MSDTSAGGDGQPGPSGQDARPHLQINAQYVKDLSFENPNSPNSLMQNEAPQIEVSVDVGARNLAGNQYEVELRITANANHGEDRAFVCEVLYGGVFTLLNVEEQALQPVCLIECPRLLFPFARRIVADCTRDGGFPPLLLEPIDFAALYFSTQARQQQQAGQPDAAPTNGGDTPQA